MSIPDPPTLQPQAARLPAHDARQPLQAAVWLKPALVLGAGLVSLDALGHWVQGGGTLLFGGLVLAGGWWLLGRRPVPEARLPRTAQGWIERCEGLLDSFARLSGEPEAAAQRRQRFEQLRADLQRSSPRLHLAATSALAPDLQSLLCDALRGPAAFTLSCAEPLTSPAAGKRWSDHAQASDLVLYSLRLPLMAADLRWLEALPAEQPLWLLVRGEAGAPGPAALAELLSHWPEAKPERLLPWSGEAAALAASVLPLAQCLARESASLRAACGLRQLEALHRDWQRDLESLRRERWRRLQLQTQWVVAAGVLAAPLPSLDLIVMAVANALMVREMASLWECPWSSDQLRLVAQELARVSLAQGVVEWSSQALLGAARLHGATWLVAGAVQALSAAYLTRVVGRAMADYLARSVGLSEPDLEAIRRQAPLLIAAAADQERLDWAGFLLQAREWLRGSEARLHPSS